MPFELHITCSKDIDKLNIDFSDGTTIIKETKRNDNEKSVKSDNKQSKKEIYLDTDINFEKVSQEIVEKPIINRNEKPVNVAQELQNFNF